MWNQIQSRLQASLILNDESDWDNIHLGNFWQNWHFDKCPMFPLKIDPEWKKSYSWWKYSSNSESNQSFTIWVLKALYYKTRSEVETWDCTSCCLTLTGTLLDVLVINLFMSTAAQFLLSDQCNLCIPFQKKWCYNRDHRW